MSLSFLFGEEKTGRFNYVLSTYFVPLEFVGVLACSNADSLTVDDEFAVFHVNIDRAFELTVHSVIFEHVCKIVYRAEVVDSYDLDVISFLSCTEYKTSDTAESVDTNFNFFHVSINFCLYEI